MADRLHESGGRRAGSGSFELAYFGQAYERGWPDGYAEHARMKQRLHRIYFRVARRSTRTSISRSRS